jgi:hypothetical protein
MDKIEITDVIYDGYERLYRFFINSRSGIALWGHGLNHEEYIESGSRQYKVPEQKTVELRIDWVNTVVPVYEDAVIGVFQEIGESSHIKCIGIVERILNGDSFLCNAGEFGNITVELETAVSEIQENMLVEFSGNLEVEFI